MPDRFLTRSSGRFNRPTAQILGALILGGWVAAASAEEVPQQERPLFNPAPPKGVVPAVQILVEGKPAAEALRLRAVEVQERVVVVNGVEQVQRIHVLIELDHFNVQTWRTWIFRTHDLQAARADLERTLQQRLAFVREHAGLTDVQVRKLELAGRGDVSRFFDDCDAALRDLETGEPSPDVLKDIRERCQALRSQMLQGLHGEGSLFAKSFQTLLTDEQRQRWEAVEAAQSPPQPLRRADQPRVLIRPNF